MKARIFSLVVAILMITGVVNAQTSFGDGLSKGKSQNKKIVVNIYSESDTWSQKMDQVYSNATISSYVNANFVYVKLNANGSDKINYGGKEYTSASLAKFFGATGYPTHVFLGPDGSLLKFTYNGESVNAFSGYVDAGDFEKLLKYFAENKYQNTDLSKVL
ncbi:MAG: thioredoxin family protein [Ignavibacteria bacterium]